MVLVHCKALAMLFLVDDLCTEVKKLVFFSDL